MSVTYIRHLEDLKDNPEHRQQKILTAETEGQSFKNFAPAVMPGKFQTRAYATTLMREAANRLGITGDTSKIVDLRMERCAMLNDPSRTFHAIITEQVMYGGSPEPEVMREQLEHLLEVGRLENVRIGIIPLGARLLTPPMSHMDIVDDKRLTVETMGVSCVFDGEPEVELYLSIFEEYAEAAWYGEEAQALIRRAML